MYKRQHCLNGVNLIQSTLSSFSNILEYPVLAVNPTVASYFKDYFALWARITTGPYPPDTKMAQSTLNLLLSGIDRMYCHRPQMQKGNKSRKEEICRELGQLVIENYTREMCIRDRYYHLNRMAYRQRTYQKNQETIAYFIIWKTQSVQQNIPIIIFDGQITALVNHGKRILYF